MRTWLIALVVIVVVAIAAVVIYGQTTATDLVDRCSIYLGEPGDRFSECMDAG